MMQNPKYLLIQGISEGNANIHMKAPGIIELGSSSLQNHKFLRIQSQKANAHKIEQELVLQLLLDVILFTKIKH